MVFGADQLPMFFHFSCFRVVRGGSKTGHFWGKGGIAKIVVFFGVFRVVTLGGRNFAIAMPLKGCIAKLQNRPLPPLFAMHFAMIAKFDCKIAKSGQRIGFDGLVVTDCLTLRFTNQVVGLALLDDERFFHDWHKLAECVVAASL